MEFGLKGMPRVCRGLEADVTGKSAYWNLGFTQPIVYSQYCETNKKLYVAPMADAMSGPSCSVKTTVIHYDLLTLTPDCLIFKASLGQ